MAGGIALSWMWAIGLIAFAFGITCGVGAAYLAFGSKRRTRELREKIDALQQELDDYRGQVGQHFQRTAELVQKMTHSYREVYEHLASGSQALCREPVNTPRLDIPETPTLAAKATDQSLDSTGSEEFSDAELDRGSLEDDEDFLGEVPNVPVFEEDDKSPANPRTRLQ
jgi:uncharacterized membrane-anchored protein YhcB (DUF1043 family)